MRWRSSAVNFVRRGEVERAHALPVGRLARSVLAASLTATAQLTPAGSAVPSAGPPAAFGAAASVPSLLAVRPAGSRGASRSRISVIRRPYCSSTTTTSPRAIGRAVDEQVGRLAGEALERHDRAGAQVERLADGHVGAADLDAELHRDLAEAAEVGRPPRRGAVPGASSNCSYSIVSVTLSPIGR